MIVCTPANSEVCVATIIVQGSPFKHQMAGPQLKAARGQVEYACVQRQLALAALRDALAAANDADMKTCIGLLLTDPNIILASAIAANRKLKVTKRRSLEECLALPQGFSFEIPFKETVAIRAMQKSSGGFRIIQDFDIRHRTAQHLIQSVMSAFFTPRAWQYTHKGIQKAIHHIKASAKAGYVFAAHLDITEFFGSFEMEKLLTVLPLPVEVVRHAVVGRYMEQVLEGSKHGHKVHGQSKPKGNDDHGPCGSAPMLSTHAQSLLTQARLGIPQGSACSSIIGAYCLSRLQWTSADDVMLLNYADDFLVLAKDQTALKKAVDGLTKAVGDVPGGSFSLKLKCTRTLNAGILFLGHQLQFKDGHFVAWPSIASDEQLASKLNEIETRLGKIVYPLPGYKFDKHAAMIELARYHAVLDGWVSAFSACDKIGKFVEAIVETEMQWLKDIGASLTDLIATITPDMEFAPDLYKL